MQIDAADRSTPRAIRAELARYAGMNRYNRANWRVVLAQERMCRRGGIFKIMPTGDVKSFEIDPKTFQMHYRDVKPDRVLSGLRDVPKYPLKGWILERWFPASKFGTQTDWEAAKSSDGVTPMMGPYPHEGDYFMLAGPWEHIPEIGDLEMAISMHIREEEAAPASYAQVMLTEINNDLAAEEKAAREVETNLAHFYESEVEPVLKGTSLAAGRIRNDMAAATGDFSHQGIA